MDQPIIADVRLTYDDQKAFVKYMKKATRRKPGIRSILIYLVIPVVLVAIGLAIGRTSVELLLLLAVVFILHELVSSSASRDDRWYEFVYKQSMVFQIELDERIIRITATSRNDEPVVREYQYDEVNDIYHSADAFYLFVDNLKPFLIPKRCITRGTAEQLAAMLREKLGDRYLETGVSSPSPSNQ